MTHPHLTPYDNVLDTIGWTPLIRLGRVGAGVRTPVYGKAEYANPGGSVKDRIGLAIIEDAELRGEESRAARRVRLSLHDNLDGTVTGHFTVPTLAGAILRAQRQLVLAVAIGETGEVRGIRRPRREAFRHA